MNVVLRTILYRKARSTLTTIGVAAGIASVMAMIAIAHGFRAQFNQLASAGRADLIVNQEGSADPALSYLPPGTIQALSETQGIATVHPLLLAVKSLPGHPYFFVYGTTAGSPFLEQVRVVEGRGFAEQIPPNAVLLGRPVASRLKLGVGDALELGGTSLRVVGIFETQVPLVGNGGLMSLETAQQVAGHDRVSFALLRLEDPSEASMQQVEAAIETGIAGVDAVRSTSFASAFQEFALADQLVAGISLLAVLFGGIGVMNTMVMSVFERTREIGVLRAIGWTKGMVLRLVLAEGTLLCTMGGLLGVGLGVLAIEAVSSVSELAWVQGAYSPLLFLEVMAIACGMGLVGAAYPAWRAVGIAPIEALRYE